MADNKILILGGPFAGAIMGALLTNFWRAEAFSWSWWLFVVLGAVGGYWAGKRMSEIMG